MIETERKSVAHGARISRRVAALAAGIMLCIFGASLIYGVGFAGAEVLHNYAHDTRHANGFPCH